MSKASFRRTVSLASALFLMVIMMTGVLGGTLSAGADDIKNYARNPGFEAGSATEAGDWGLHPGWDKGSFIGGEVHSGNRAVSVALDAEQNYALFQGGIDGGVMDIGGASTLSMWVKYTGITGDGFMIGAERKAKDDKDGNADAFSQRYTGSSDGWTQLTFDIPATDKALKELIIKVEIAPGGGTLLIDDVALHGAEAKPPVADPGKNYARNPGFEAGSATEAGDWGLHPGWDKGSFIGGEVHSGERAVSVTLDAEQNYALFQGGHKGGDFDLKSGAEISFWVKYNLTAGSFKLILERITAAGNDNVVGEAVTGSADGWTEVKLTVPASTQSITEWVIKIDITPGAGTLLIDDAALNIVTGSDPAPDVPDDKKPGVVNTGETGANLLSNPGFEGGDQDWGVVNGASVTGAETHSGAKAVKAVLGAEGYASWNNLTADFDMSAALRVAFWVKLDGVTGEGVTVGVERECIDENDEWADGSVYSRPLKGTADWQKVVVEVPAAPGCFKVVAKINFGAGSGTAYIDDAYIGLADQSEENKNYAANAGFEKGPAAEAEKWGLAPGWDKVPAPIETADVHGGSRAVKITLGDAERSLFQSNNWGMPDFDLKSEMFLSMWVKYTGVTGDGAYLKVERKAGNESVADVSGTPVTGTSDGWVQLKLLAPATTEALEEVVVCLNVGAGAGTVLVDDVTFRPATQEDRDNIDKTDPDSSGPSAPPAPETPATGAALPLSAAAVAAASAAVILVWRKRRG